MKILNEQQEILLKNERQALNQLQVLLIQFGATPEDIKTLNESIQQLDDLFLLVIVGEFNAGKSAFINALFGQPYLKEGVTPTTTHINLLKYGQVQERAILNEHQHVLYLPVDWLHEISIVDTPGTNAIIRAHEVITSQFIPRSDLVLFVTSADRPFTESERAFLEKTRDWGKKIVFVINKIDILLNQGELDQVKEFVAENARLLLGISPEIFPLSSRLALRAKLGESELWGKSQFEALETYILNTLDEKSRLLLKFKNPLGVATYFSDQYLNVVASRLDLLKVDFEMISDVETQLSLYKEDMDRDFNYRLADIENILYKMEKRGQDYFDSTFRLARIFDLLSKERIRTEFEQQVVSDVPQLIEKKVAELIDWLVESDLRQWQAVNDHLAERRRAHHDRIVGDSGFSTFAYNRDQLIDAVGRETQRIVEIYDKSTEAETIARNAQEAVAASAVLEVGAVGLGTIIAVMATTVAADVTGILLASFVAALGIFVIPARRRAAKAELREKVATMRQDLTATLRSQIKKEIERSLNRITDAIAPYTRFVRSERSKLLEMESNLQTVKSELERLTESIQEMGQVENDLP